MKKINYHEIFKDIISNKIEHSNIDLNIEFDFKNITNLNEIIFKEKTAKNKKSNSRLKSYKINEIKSILKIHKQQNLSTKEICAKFKIARNTFFRWQKTIKL